ncbi:MAG: hypothetical protein Q7U75_08485 [Desulfobacterales bacterium]|nr:hypothetical protein [Desulfobacterales bacterium]
MTHHRLPTLLAALALPWLGVAGCGGGNDGPGPGPDPDSPRVEARVLLAPSTARLYDSPPDWTTDDRLLVFTGPPGGNVWRLDAAGGTPVALTDTLNTAWAAGAYAPGCLAEGRVAFYQGWLTGDRHMHVMTADTAAVVGVPAAVVLRRFTGTAVGLAENQASSPQTLTYSRYGLRAAGLWRAPWLLEWSYEGGDESVTSRSPVFLRGATDIRISRDGLRVAFVDVDKRVSWMEFEGDAVTVVGEGVAPSWRGDSAAIGYLDHDGDYVLFELEDSTRTVFEATALRLGQPVLSWAGDRVAYLIRTESGIGLGVGTLVP